MRRRVALAVLVLVVVLGVAAALLVRMVRRDRAALLRQFAGERLAQVQKAVREVESDVADICEDLVFAGQLVYSAESSADAERELAALLAVVRRYQAAAVFDPAGQLALQVRDPTAGPVVAGGRLSPEIEATARRALTRPPGEVEISPPVAVAEGEWYRIFATAFPGQARGGPKGAVVLVVTGASFVADLRLLATVPGTRQIMLGAQGQPTPATDPELVGAIQHLSASSSPTPQFAELVARMRAGEAGTMRLGSRAAAQVGLAGGDFVAAYSPVRVQGGRHWAVATLSSAVTLRRQERVIALRVAAISGTITVCLLALAGYLVVGARRAIAMRERLRHAEELAHVHELAQKILDNIPAYVVVLGEDGHVTVANRALRDRTPEGVIGRRLEAAFPAAPAAVLERIQRLLGSAAHSGRVQSLHGARLALFGEEGQYSLHAVPLEARLPGACEILVIDDVSEVHSLESQLVRAAKLSAVGVLAAGIAHEIGTPLGIVRARAELMSSRLGAGHPQTPAARVIVEQVDQVSRTILQLLDFSRVKPATVLPVAVGQAVRAVVELLQFEIQRRGVAIETAVPGDVPLVAADPDQLQQVLVNLVLNACDACQAGGKIRIDAHDHRADGSPPWSCVRIAIIDDGCGIPPELAQQVFDPFFTTKKRGQGTGLGLTIAAQIVRNHGGQVDLESEPGRGTHVSVLWPTAPKERKEAPPDAG